MSGVISIDTREFKKAIKFVQENTKKALPEILNQRAFNIAARTLDALPPKPGGEAGTRGRIKQYMDTPKSEPKLRVVQSGRKRGQLTRVGSVKNRLTLKNLIIQKRRSKKGLKGLYGAEMRELAGDLSRRAQVGVGFIKTPFLPIIKGLIALVKYKRVATRWGRISVWPGGKGFGKVKPATDGNKPFVEFKLAWKVPGTPSKVERMIVPKLQAAMTAEAKEMVRHTEERLRKIAERVNAKKL